MPRITDRDRRVDKYIAAQPKPVRARLERLRRVIRKAAPQAQETFSYGVPGYKLRGNLLHFANWKQWIGFYGAGAGLRAYRKQTAPYVASKGTLRFPHDKPVPLALVTKIVRLRVKEKLAK